MFLPEQLPSLFVLDDLMGELVDADKVMDLLCKEARHLNLFVIVVTQNLYAFGKHSVGMNHKANARSFLEIHLTLVTLKHWATLNG